MLNQYQDIMTVLEVADALYIGKNRVYELLASGMLKGFRIGKVWKIPKLSVEQFILSQANISFHNSST